MGMRKEIGADVLSPESFGNRFSQGQLTFPIHLADPLAIFANVKAQSDSIKVSPEPVVRQGMVKFLVGQNANMGWDAVCDAMLDSFGKVTAMLSNVPGPLEKV